jgi:broad specificity phosphatase PhoE
VFQGLTWPEIEARYSTEGSRWKSHEPDFVIPGGESRSELQARGTAVLNDIRDAGYEQVVVVSHGGLLSAALKGILQIPEKLNPFRFYNAAINHFEWEEQLKIVAINRVEHLRAINAELATRTGDL